MKKNLCKRGYTNRSIINELKKVDKLDRNNLLQYRTDKSKTDRVPPVLTYSKGLPHVREIIKKKMTVLHKSEKMKIGFVKPPILAFRRDKNLKDILFHKKHNSMFFKQEHKCEPCCRNCAICPYVRNTQTFTNFEGKTFNVKNYINCTTANCKQWFTLYFVSIVTNLFTSEKPETPFIKDIC